MLAEFGARVNAELLAQRPAADPIKDSVLVRRCRRSKNVAMDIRITIRHRRQGHDSFKRSSDHKRRKGGG
jgi:hypothetical protein